MTSEKRHVRGIRSPAPPGHFPGNLGSKPSDPYWVSIEDIANIVGRILSGQPGQGPGGGYPPGPPVSPVSELIFQMTAGANLSGERVVRVNSSGLAVYPDIDAVNEGIALVGISLHAALTGDFVQVQFLGPLSRPVDFAWTPGLPIYCADNGVLTQSPTSGKWVRQVAIATEATAILIQPQDFISTPL